MGFQVTLSNYAVAAMDNTATGINTVVSGAKEWVKHSDIIWASTALSYYGVGFVNQWLNNKIDQSEAAKVVFIALSIGALLKGFFAEAKTEGKPAETNENLTKLPNLFTILLSNTVATTAYIVYKRLGLKLSVLEASLVTVLAGGAIKMIHPILSPYLNK